VGYRAPVSEATTKTHWFVVFVIAVVALSDVITGGVLLLARAPTWAHGPGTVWGELLPLLEDGAEHRAAVLSLFRRIGAFQAFVGLATLIWLAVGLRRDRTIITVLLTVYLVLGGLFFATDLAFFRGTTYLVTKQIIGTAWLLAFGVHLWTGRSTARHELD